MAHERSAGNLIVPRTNPAASRADLRAPRAARARPVAVPQTMGAAAKPTGFEAAMAMSDSQNRILGEVLEGPVSQQTQRQLARLRESGARGQLAGELRQGRNPALAAALLQNDGSAPAPGTVPAATSIVDAAASLTAGAAAHASGTDAAAAASSAAVYAGRSADQQADQQADQAAARPNRRPGMLLAGRTIAAGLDTGRIFTPAQLAAFRQRNGLGLSLDPSRNQPTDEARAAAVAGEAASHGAADMPALEGASMAEASASSSASTSSQAAAASRSLSEPAKPGARGSASGDVEAIIERVAQALGLDPALIKAVIQTESNFNHRAVSPAGAQGLMQLMPGTAREMGVNDPFNPMENIWGGARYLKRMLDSHGGNLNRALAAYNWGPGNFRRSGGKSLPRETRRYIESVNRHYARFKREAAATTA